MLQSNWSAGGQVTDWDSPMTWLTLGHGYVILKQFEHGKYYD